MEKSFPPIIFEDSEILILGTYPSLQSFEEGFYYAHPRNQFWKILSDLCSEAASTVEEKKSLLKKHRFALWDTCHTCIRQNGNSSDLNLSEIEPNDIALLLEKFPTITKICFTGKKAQSIYYKHFARLAIETALLPSPSPAYQAMRFEEKKAIYKRELFG